jgi:predicted acylesterase/phospholipase RssA
MSMSIPFMFEPVREKLPASGETCYVVDGGLLSNYPVHLFDEEGAPSWPTFGFSLREPSEARPVRTRIRGPVSMGLAIFNSMFSAMDRWYVEEQKWDRTIGIPTLGVAPRAVRFWLRGREEVLRGLVGLGQTRAGAVGRQDHGANVGGADSSAPGRPGA